MAGVERARSSCGRGGRPSAVRAWAARAARPATRAARPAVAALRVGLGLALLGPGQRGLPGPLLAAAAVLEGELPTQSYFSEYVGKFCYDFSVPVESIAGELHIDTLRERQRPDSTNAKLYFMIFDDEQKHWKKAQRRWAVSTCEEKEQEASLSREVDLHSDEQLFSFQIHIQEHVRPRFWYFAFVACGIDSDLQLRYKLHMTNDLWGWQKEFSLDHMGMFAAHAVFAVFFLLALLGTTCASRSPSGTAETPLRAHPYVQLLLLSLMASLASSALILTHYGLFLTDGFGSKRIRFLGVLACIVANCTVFLIAILSSVGWAISTPLLPHRRGFLALLALVGGLNAVCELHAEVFVDQTTHLYSYQSVPATLSLMLKVFMFCWIAFQTKATHDDERDAERRRFYKVLGTGMALWSLNVPVTAMLAYLVSPWYRYKVVTSVELTARFLGTALLAQLFCGRLSPLNADNTFPDRDLIDFPEGYPLSDRRKDDI